MLKTGLTSVTFRKISPSDIVQLAVCAGLDGIEWGGDFHVPPGNLKLAKEVRRITEVSGLHIISYGSYYLSCFNKKDTTNFLSVLETAIALGAPNIRIWAGGTGSCETSEWQRKTIIDRTICAAEQAAKAGVKLSFEYHSNTLTDTAESAINLIKDINMPNVQLYWQPFSSLTSKENQNSLKRVLPMLEHIHVFHWEKMSDNRLSLSDGRDIWEDYIKIAETTERDRYFLLEFVKNDCIEQFFEDAKVLHQMIEKG